MVAEKWWGIALVVIRKTEFTRRTTYNRPLTGNCRRLMTDETGPYAGLDGSARSRGTGSIV
jgi:hypothetical protein